MNEEALITIIVPVYNQEKYLARCLQSIIDQTYKNLEILVIDDASTDASLEIIEQFVDQDKRIRLIRNHENRGLSYTRNVGLENAKGDYIGFVDSDDDIEPTMFEVLCSLIHEYNTDISGCRYNVLRGEADIKALFDESLPEIEKISTEEATERVLLKNGCSDAVWDKLFRTCLFSDIRMIEGMLYEDQEVLLRIFAEAKDIVLTNRKLYNYYRRPKSNSITQGVITEKRHDLLIARLHMHKTVQKAFPGLEKLARNRYLEAALKFLYDSRNIPDSDQIRRKTKAEITAFIKENGGLNQRKDILLCLIAMKTSLRLFDLLFCIRERI